MKKIVLLLIFIMYYCGFSQSIQTSQVKMELLLDQTVTLFSGVDEAGPTTSIVFPGYYNSLGDTVLLDTRFAKYFNGSSGTRYQSYTSKQCDFIADTVMLMLEVYSITATSGKTDNAKLDSSCVVVLEVLPSGPSIMSAPDTRTVLNTDSVNRKVGVFFPLHATDYTRTYMYKTLLTGKVGVPNFGKVRMSLFRLANAGVYPLKQIKYKLWLIKKRNF